MVAKHSADFMVVVAKHSADSMVVVAKHRADSMVVVAKHRADSMVVVAKHSADGQAEMRYVWEGDDLTDAHAAYLRNIRVYPELTANMTSNQRLVE